MKLNGLYADMYTKQAKNYLAISTPVHKSDADAAVSVEGGAL